MVPVFASRAAFAAKHAAFSEERWRDDRTSYIVFALAVLGLLMAAALYPPLAAHATAAIALGLVVLFAGLYLHGRRRWGALYVIAGYRCPGCDGELVSLGYRLRQRLLLYILRTGACPFCATPLFPVSTPGLG